MLEADQRLLSVDDLARFLGVPPETVRSWRRRRIGPRAIVIGRHLKYRPSELEQWLAEQEEKSA